MLRSACVPLLKIAATRHELLASLAEIRPLDRRDITFEPSDSMVVDAIFWFGVQGYEGILAKLWADLCSKATSVLEVGGNIGFYSVIGGKAAKGSYTVVEPVPEVAMTLRANLRRNGLSAVEVLEAAATTEADAHDACLSLPNEGRAMLVGAHLRGEVEISKRSISRTIMVKGLPIAHLIKGRDLIKIDAEGSEHALLAAALPDIGQHKPTIVVEVLPESEKLAALIADMAARNGYTINIVPAYGDDTIKTVSSSDFSASLPAQFNSKDIVLSCAPLASPSPCPRRVDS